MPPLLHEMWAQIGSYRGPLRDARISPADHGFLYGDAVYETMRTLAGEVFRWDLHLQRLRQSAEGIYLEVPWTDQELTHSMEQFRQVLPPGEHYLRLIVSRGEAALGYAPDPDQRSQCVWLGGIYQAPSQEKLRQGWSAALVARRRNPIASLSPLCKTNNLLNPRLAHMEALRLGYEEAVLCNAHDQLAEGSNSNVFLARGDDLLVTPSLSCGLLPGITRALLIELARTAGIRIEERPIAREEVVHFDEAFLSSTTRTIGPLRRLGDTPMIPYGPMAQRLSELFKSKFGGI